jgi:hypothetical protein
MTSSWVTPGATNDQGSIPELIVIGSSSLRTGGRPHLMNPSALACQEHLSPLSLLLCQPKAETRHLVLLNELNPGFFKRCLDPH